MDGWKTEHLGKKMCMGNFGFGRVASLNRIKEIRQLPLEAFPVNHVMLVVSQNPITLGEYYTKEEPYFGAFISSRIQTDWFRIFYTVTRQFHIRSANKILLFFIFSKKIPNINSFDAFNKIPL